VILPLGEGQDGKERLLAAGIELREENGRALIDNVVFGSPAEKTGLDFDQEIVNVQMPTGRPAKQWMFVPALLLLGLIVFLQKARARRQVPATA